MNSLSFGFLMIRIEDIFVYIVSLVKQIPMNSELFRNDSR